MITHGKIIMEDFLMMMTPLEKKKNRIYVSAPVGSDDRRLKEDFGSNFKGCH